PRAGRDVQNSREAEPADRPCLPQPCLRDENRRPPAYPAAPRSPRLHPSATSPPIFSQEIAAPLPGDTTSVHGSRRGQVSHDGCAPSSPRPPSTVRPEESSAGLGRRRGPIPHSSFLKS